MVFLHIGGYIMKKRNIAMGIGCAIVYCAALLLIFRGYYKASSNTLSQLLYENQKMNIQAQQRDIISKVDNVHTTLKTIVTALETCDTEAEMQRYKPAMEQLSAASDIQALGVEYYSFSTMKAEDIAECGQQTIEQLKEGESVISKVYEYPSSQKTYYTISEPVSLNNQYVGFVRGMIVSDILLSPPRTGVFEGDTETYLIYGNGEDALANNQYGQEINNLFKNTQEICDEPEKLYELKKMIDEGNETATIQTTSQGKTLILSCARLPYNDWRVFNIIRSDSIDSYAQKMTVEGRKIVLLVMGMASLIILIFLVVYGIIGKKQHYEKERAALLENFSDTVLCEYDIKKDCISCTSNIVKMLPIQETRLSHFRTYVAEKGLIHSDDQETVKQILATMPKEGEILDYNVRLKNTEGGYNWYRLDVIAIYIKGKLQDQLIIKINDITEQKEHELGLLKKAESDVLTGLLNRDTFEKRVKRKMQDTGGYMFLLDLDNFKMINDKYGHQVGDELLKKTAQCICHNFRYKDDVARYGGDEFLMFMESPVSESVVKNRLTVLVDEISKLTLENYPDLRMTCSVGAAKSTGEEYEVLLKKADKAMYQAKETKKNCWIML